MTKQLNNQPTKQLNNQPKIKDGFRGERSLIMPDAVRQQAMDDPMLSTLYITDIGFYPHAVHHYRQRTEPIEQWVLIYCTNGSGRYMTGDRHYEVHANQYFILPAGVPHAYASNNDDPWSIYWIHFGGTRARYYAGDTGEPVNVSPNINSRIADRNNIFEDIFATLSNGYTTENLRYTTSLLHFYLGSLRYLPIYRQCHKRTTNEEGKDENIITNATLQYMEENLDKPITLQELANYTGYSISHLTMVFKSNTGHSPLNYFNMLKIKKACELLETTSMKVNQISCMVGIYDSYYFSRLFTKVVGISPRKFRERGGDKGQKHE